MKIILREEFLSIRLSIWWSLYREFVKQFQDAKVQKEIIVYREAGRTDRNAIYFQHVSRFISQFTFVDDEENSQARVQQRFKILT